MTYYVPDLIGTKRDGYPLSGDQLRWMVDAYTDRKVTDYQMSSFLMAVLFQGMNESELASWTSAMLNSGATLDLSGSPLPKVDKHSTGGVGDKTSLILGPLVAACGVGVPMMSGRGLGHTGGTVDKLESIPGYRTELTIEEFTRQFEDIGIVLAGQSDELCPADRRIYALRDGTGTVPSVPLIASSIMSKKLAEDLDALILDVKVGTGAFMRDIEHAEELSETMVAIGRTYDTPVIALLTAMDEPLGHEVGNANEVAESIATLRGEGPPDLVELVMALGVEMMAAGGIATGDEARHRLEEAIASGAALRKFGEVIEAQDGDPGVIDDPDLLPSAPHVAVVTATNDGYISRVDALTVGQAAVRLGAGRATMEDIIDHSVGITVHVKVGDEVTVGAPLASVRYADEEHLGGCFAVLDTAWGYSDQPVERAPLILGKVE